MALRLIYDDRQLTFEELLNKDKSVTIHQRCLQVFATVLYKVHRGWPPDIMNVILRINFHLQQEMLNLFIMTQKQYPI